MAPFPISRIADHGWNILRQQMPLPLAVLKESALANNARWIHDFASRAGIHLCPHGKTTMCPQIFSRQLEGGAWGITLSTAHQVHVARANDVQRILVANQILDPVFLDYVLAELERDPDFDFFCLVDSVDGVDFIRNRAKARRCPRPVQVLLEAGMQGGRTGCRDLSLALDIARTVRHSEPAVVLAGVEGFEGIVPSSVARDPQPVEDFLAFMEEMAQAIDAERLFGTAHIILSAGGSAYFDIVAARLGKVCLGRPHRVVIRSGCYITHDSGMYVSYFSEIEKRSPMARSILGGLAPALEIIAYVQSIPEAGLAILNAGKRDCSYDVDMPVPHAWARPNVHRRPNDLGNGYSIASLNDQHGYMKIPESSPLTVGDMVFLGISHPCTTFDKWDILYGIDDEYNVVSAFKTYF